MTAYDLHSPSSISTRGFYKSAQYLQLGPMISGTGLTRYSQMQTFLPYSDFRLSAACLDYRRLGKQRVEAMQLLLGQWPNHPASKMWRGYEDALAFYGFCCCEEWVKRGYKNRIIFEYNSVMARWGGPIHSSHRSNLLRKDYVWYSRFGWSEPTTLPYVWS